MNALRTQSIGRMERMCPSAVVFFLRDVTPARIPARWRADVLGVGGASRSAMDVLIVENTPSPACIVIIKTLIARLY